MILESILTELYALYRASIIGYPSSVIGNWLRRGYWSKCCKIKNLRYIGRGASINSRDTLRIGNNFILGDDAIIDNTDSYGCYIGDNVGVARGSYIRTANHNLEDVNKSWMEQGHTAKLLEYAGSQYSVVIEDDVWIGAHAVILSGAYIGKGSVISAGSIVSSFIPPYSIVVGNPARVVANREKLAIHAIQAKNPSNE